MEAPKGTKGPGKTNPGHATCELRDEHYSPRCSIRRRSLCLAGSYQKHVTETGRKAKAREVARHAVPIHEAHHHDHWAWCIDSAIKMTDQLDWELELGVVIGKTAKNVPEEKALDVVARYTVTNDISSRLLLHGSEVKDQDWQKFFDRLMGKRLEHVVAPMRAVDRDKGRNPRPTRACISCSLSTAS